jgi:protein SCO1/2
LIRRLSWIPVLTNTCRSLIHCPLRLLLLAVCLTLVSYSTVTTAEEQADFNRLGARFLESGVQPGDFRLRDHRGETFDNNALNGKWSVVFFGYASCADICPTTLAVMNQLYQRLDKEQYDMSRIQFVFVSVDPVRDSPEVLRDHVTFFNPAFLGVTGERRHINRLVYDLGARYDFMERETRKIITDIRQLDAKGDYLVGHMGDLFVIAPNGRLVGYIYPPHQPQRSYEALRLIQKSAHRHLALEQEDVE